MLQSSGENNTSCTLTLAGLNFDAATEISSYHSTIVGIAIRYGLDRTGIESLRGRDFLHPSRPALGTTQRPMQWVPGVFPRGKAAGVWR